MLCCKDCKRFLKCHEKVRCFRQDQHFKNSDGVSKIIAPTIHRFRGGLRICNIAKYCDGVDCSKLIMIKGGD